ncbi:hypothetical protein [Sulfuricurvum sp.]|uniref:hypothetical protein n=1 Tax=Sulfuricurvum sp. TaxID=2025608 RepID=UPI003BAE8F42
MIYDAYYLPSNLACGKIEFSIELEWEREDTKEGFEKLTRVFMQQVNTFGKTIPLPQPIIQKLCTDEHIDTLLQDTEFIPELTYFLKLDSKDIFISKYNADTYKLQGSNGIRCLFETMSGELIDVVKTNEILGVFEKMWE